MTYSIDDEFGTELTTGLQSHEADRVAQTTANRLGQTVYLYSDDVNDDGPAYKTVEPE